MFGTSKFVKSFLWAMAFAGAALIAGGEAFADKLYLKDGRVLEGKVVREGKDFLFFRVKIGTVESDQMFTSDQFSKVERDDATPKNDENLKKEADAKQQASAKTDTGKHTGATRVAILNFGCPSEWQGKYDDMVGLQVNADSFHRAIPLLEKDHVDVVVVRVKSGGGALSELAKFHDVFEKEYKPKFRTVAWIESAISAAAMSPWVLEEMYFYPQGNIGACTGWHGDLVAVKGIQLEMVLDMMEKASAMGKKDPAIMRAMQIMEPLSADIDENGEVHWHQNESGAYILNRSKNVFTMNANDAIKFKFGKGIAATRDELAKAMGLQEVEWAGQEATDFIDRNIKETDGTSKQFRAMYAKYQLAIELAKQLQDKERRGIELGKARRLLAEMKQRMRINPNLKDFIGIPDGWFEEQEEIIRKLAQLP
jgi:hypothetical protein